jgi:RNA polymerase sigma-70 factor (ECF subfamily)
MHDESIMTFADDGLGETVGSHDFDALFRAERDGLYRTMLAFTGGRTDIAEDATAEAFARAFARREDLRDPIAWIYRAAFRIATDEVRHDKRRTTTPEIEVLGGESSDMSDLISALRQLSPRQRAAIVLRHVADLEMTEIARRMGTATPTVRVHLHRGRTKLRELLGSDEEVER